MSITVRKKNGKTRVRIQLRDLVITTKHLKFGTWEIDRITPHARNPRRNDEAVDQMCASLLEYRLKLPLLVGEDRELSAELGGRSCLGVASEPRCVDVTVRRGEHLTGRTATPDGDGRSFAEMAQVLHPALDRKGRA